jgi:molybdate transport system permease protein
LGIEPSFTTAVVVMAELFVAAHFYVRQAVGFAVIDRDVEEAAMVDSAGCVVVFTEITLPLAFLALVAGAVTAWARALGEFGGTIVFAGSFQGVIQTMPLAIYGTLERDFDAAEALSVMVLGFSFAVILAARFFTQRTEGHAGQD